MADNGRTPDLDAITRSDRLLDALAAGESVNGGDAGDRALHTLMAGWRDELRWPPATGLVAENQAVAALEQGRHEAGNRAPQRGRGFALVGTVAATVLGIGGFGAVLSTAQPGDALYGLRSTLFGEPPSVRDDQVVLAAQTEFAKVQQLIDTGQWDQAKDALAGANDAVQQVNDTGRKQDLVDQWNQLNVKVEKQDPAATLPPSPASDPAVPPGLTTSTTTVSTTGASDTSDTSATSKTSETSATSEASETSKTSETSRASETSKTSESSETSKAPETSKTSPSPSAGTTATTTQAPANTAETTAVQTTAPARATEAPTEAPGKPGATTEPAAAVEETAPTAGEQAARQAPAEDPGAHEKPAVPQPVDASAESG